MLTVAITAPVGAASIGTAGLMDALNKADNSWALQAGATAPRLFDVCLVGLHGSGDNPLPVPCRDGVLLQPRTAASNLPTPDLVVIPGLDDDLDDSFVRNRGWVRWIAAWHRAGAVVASSCTGAFLAAEAGLLDGRPATTHWMFADLLHRRYPKVVLAADQMIVDTGDIISSGGATAFLTLVLYLVERFGGHQRANLAAKVLLADGHRSSQLPYVAFSADRSHGDQLIHRIQQHIDGRLDQPLRTGELAAHFALSTRTLGRRFQAATGRGPQAYLQHARVQQAKRLLETTDDPIDQIRLRVGYHDPAAFRRAFHNATGLTPSDYRRRYGLPNHQSHTACACPPSERQP
jgi:transcriptional regulator GlxA family with amidase domain